MFTEAASYGCGPRFRRVAPPDGSGPGFFECPRFRPAASRLLRILAAADRAAAWGISSM